MFCPSVETLRGELLSQEFYLTAPNKRKEKLTANNKIQMENREAHSSFCRIQRLGILELPGEAAGQIEGKKLQEKQESQKLEREEYFLQFLVRKAVTGVTYLSISKTCRTTTTSLP